MLFIVPVPILSLSEGGSIVCAAIYPFLGGPAIPAYTKLPVAVIGVVPLALRAGLPTALELA